MTDQIIKAKIPTASEKEYERGKALALIRKVNYSSDEIAEFMKRKLSKPFELGFRDGLKDD